MTLNNLTAAQRKFIKHIVSRIAECEGDIPVKNWCSSCLLKLQRVAELVERFHRHRRLRHEAETQEAISKAYGAAARAPKDPRWPNPREPKYWDFDTGTHGFS